jgi:hypothetical protein
MRSPDRCDGMIFSAIQVVRERDWGLSNTAMSIGVFI